MRFKFDECLDARLAVVMREIGHDVATVRDQGLHGIPDHALYERCAEEGYILVTLDLVFSNVFRFPPEPTPGLVVFRGPNDLFPTMRILVRTLVSALTTGAPSGRWWIVEPGRVRIHEPSIEGEE